MIYEDVSKYCQSMKGLKEKGGDIIVNEIISIDSQWEKHRKYYITIVATLTEYYQL